MKNILPVFLFILLGFNLSGQDIYEAKEGKISYVTTQNVYVKFTSTENIKSGDTLFAEQNGVNVPVATVKEISSISCVCIPIGLQRLSVGDKLVTNKNILITAKAEPAPEAKIVAPVANADTSRVKPAENKKPVQKVTGNFSVSSFLNFSNVGPNSQRMKYTFAMVAQNIGNSKLSADVYISFAHQLNIWSEVQKDIFNGLKIYSLALNYEFNKHHTIWLGRKINPRISNVGAIDGLQYEARAGNVTFGLVAGTRPDYMNYSFNASLLQAGGYIGHDLNGKNGNMQTTVAFINQTNNGATDRRFAYFQHTNSLLRNLFFFGSVEVELYNKTMNLTTVQDPVVHTDTSYKQNNSPHLSNLYLSLRYRPIRQLSFSLSYSNRQNVIYYETYKSIVDQLLEAATIQGYTFQVNAQPAKYLSIGLNAGYRDSKKDPKPSKNLYVYLSYTQIPGINVAATISATLLETSYMSGKIYSVGITRDLVPGKLSTGLDYRYVSYTFYGGESKLAQNMGEVNFTWRILRKLSFGLYYEGTFDKTSTFNRVYVNLTQRF